MRFRFPIISILIINLTLFLNPFFCFGLTVKEEKDIGKEVLAQVKRAFPVVDDHYIESYIQNLGDKIVQNSNNKLFDFNFFVIRDSSYNAFAVPGGYIFIHTGLISAMEHESELAGIIAHEIAHVNARHIAQQVEDSKKVSMATLAGLAAGIVLGMNGADPDAVMGLISGTQAAGQSAMLSYSREHERDADSKGLGYLVKSGYSPEGLLDILEKIRSKEVWTTTEVPVYMRTHPGTKERIHSISDFIEKNSESLPGLAEQSVFSDFNKVRIKITALYEKKDVALQKMEEIAKDESQKPLSYYGKAVLAMKEGDYEKSADFFSETLKYNALDMELLFDYGKTLFLKGDYSKAIDKFNSIKNSGTDFPELNIYLGRSYINIEQYNKAKTIFEKLTARNPDNKYAWYYLGIANEKVGFKGLAHYSLARYHEIEVNEDVCIFHYKKAVSLLDGAKKAEAEKRLKDFRNKDKKKKKNDKEDDQEENTRQLNKFLYNLN
ncbi:MAG: M48 family metalloprotease [Thermodesulfobacteriota bacterium]